MPPLYKRIWICLRHPKDWIIRLKLGAATTVLWNEGIDPDLSVDLKNITNRLWDEAFKNK